MSDHNFYQSQHSEDRVMIAVEGAALAITWLACCYEHGKTTTKYVFESSQCALEDVLTQVAGGSGISSPQHRLHREVQRPETAWQTPA